VIPVARDTWHCVAGAGSDDVLILENGAGHVSDNTVLCVSHNNNDDFSKMYSFLSAIRSKLRRQRQSRLLEDTVSTLACPRSYLKLCTLFILTLNIYQRITDSNHRHFLSSSSSQPVIRRTRLSTVGDYEFPVAGSRLWNSLPSDVTSAPTLTVFPNCLKNCIFSRSFLPNCFPFLVLYTVYSIGLAVLYLSGSK